MVRHFTSNTVSVIVPPTTNGSTGVVVAIDWNRMSLQQTGTDTKWIDRLYRIHYLQWTGVKSIDRILGFAGITLVLVLTGLGACLAFGVRRPAVALSQRDACGPST